MKKTSSKFLLPQSLRKKIQNLQKQGKKIVFTNGCFDLLHIGHIRLLKEAKKSGDILVVAVNTDASVKKLKGLGRPIIPLKERAEVLCALESVDYVTCFNEQTPEALIAILKPQVLVKGADYKMNRVVGSDIVKAHGGKVLLVPLYKEKSSSQILKKIKGS